MQLRSAGAVDAIYLDLHGAMVAEHIDDADGELLRRIRARRSARDLPIVASLDFHANVSPQMAESRERAGVVPDLSRMSTWPRAARERRAACTI